MACVYRYRTPLEKRTVYIGKTNGDIKSLAGRISAHAHEEIFINNRTRKGYLIDYIEGLTAADADILETALIAQSEKPPDFNRAKTDWGASGFVDLTGLSWKTWPPIAEEKSSQIAINTGERISSYFRCSICGKTCRVGQSRKPSYMLIREDNNDFSSIRTLWLCNDCAIAATSAVHNAIDSLKIEKEDSVS